jgi:hypothetical protein
MTLPRTALVLTVVNLALLLFTAAQIRHTTAQDAAAVLRTQAIELVDEAGQVRSRLNVEENGEVVFRLLDQDGAIRVKLGAWRGGSGLLLNDDATEAGVHLCHARRAAASVPRQDG